jgi:putative protein-disulfide isomerase
MTSVTVAYLFDPLCGWCYGALPKLEKLAATGQSIEALPTGLFSGPNARPVDQEFAAYAWSADQRIARLSGQIFSEAYRVQVLDARETSLDSGAATLGITAAGLPDPHRRLIALKAIQRGRYVDGRDVVSAAGVAAVLSDVGMVEEAELLRAPTERLLAARRELIGRGQALLQRLRARGVPALAVIRGDVPRLIGSDALFGSDEDLVSQIHAA